MAYDKEIVSRIWQNYSALDIIRDLAPGTDREERELFERISETRIAIEQLVRDLPEIIEAALRKGFTQREVVDVITEKGEGLVPSWNLEVMVAGIAGKLGKENSAEREAAERAEAEAKQAAIQKTIDDALANLRAMGAQI